MRKVVLSTLLTLCMTILLTGVAFAAHENLGDRSANGRTLTVNGVTYGDNTVGYMEAKNAAGCNGCHTGSSKHTYGPHGGYSGTSNKCYTCHTVHRAQSTNLLPGNSVTAVCNFCHDLTGTTEGPYSGVNLTSAADIKSAHRVVGVAYFSSLGGSAVATIPGGDATTGGDAAATFSGEGKMSNLEFTCDSCHTPHAVVGTTVGKYLGESGVKASTSKYQLYLTNRILKNTINGTTVTDYGTAWCATCHKGRDNMGDATNHPVNESGKAYNFFNGDAKDGATVGITEAEAITAGVVYYNGTNGGFNMDPRSNKRFAMVAGDPLNGNAARPDGNVAYNNLANAGAADKTGPTCQQCHASARDVEKTFGDAGDTDNKGMTFPHMSTKKALLVEEGDDFCTNCHGLNLP